MTRLPTTRGATGRGAHSSYEHLAKGLGVFSVALGLVELFATRPLARALGMEGRETLLRTYGARELATGVAILMSHDPSPWIYGRVAGDAIDLATLGVAARGDDAPTGNIALATVAVAGVTIADIICAQGLTAGQRLSEPGTYDYTDRTGFPRPPRAMRGAASDFQPPADFRVPDALRPWTDGKPSPASEQGSRGTASGEAPLAPSSAFTAGLT